MSMTRGLAVRISAVVVRWASPESKEWAEGLKREIEFVEGDLASLGWALGSLWMLLTTAARKNAPRRSPVWWFMPPFLVSQILLNIMSVMRASNRHDRIASGLIAFGYMCWAALSATGWLWQRNQPPISDLQAYTLFNRATLERRLEHYRSLRRWLPLSIPVSICTGFVMNFEGWHVFGAVAIACVLAFGTIAVWMLCLDTPAKIEARLKRVNERISKTAGKGHAEAARLQ